MGKKRKNTQILHSQEKIPRIENSSNKNVIKGCQRRPPSIAKSGFHRENVLHQQSLLNFRSFLLRSKCPPKNERIAPNHSNLPNLSIRYAQFFHTELIEFMVISQVGFIVAYSLIYHSVDFCTDLCRDLSAQLEGKILRIETYLLSFLLYSFLSSLVPQYSLEASRLTWVRGSYGGLSSSMR